jgi:hypothetical protein
MTDVVVETGEPKETEGQVATWSSIRQIPRMVVWPREGDLEEWSDGKFDQKNVTQRREGLTT